MILLTEMLMVTGCKKMKRTKELCTVDFHKTRA